MPKKLSSKSRQALEEYNRLVLELNRLLQELEKVSNTTYSRQKLAIENNGSITINGISWRDDYFQDRIDLVSHELKKFSKVVEKRTSENFKQNKVLEVKKSIRKYIATKPFSNLLTEQDMVDIWREIEVERTLNE